MLTTDIDRLVTRAERDRQPTVTVPTDALRDLLDNQTSKRVIRQQREIEQLRGKVEPLLVQRP